MKEGGELEQPQPFPCPREPTEKGQRDTGSPFHLMGDAEVPPQDRRGGSKAVPRTLPPSSGLVGVGAVQPLRFPQ